MKSLDETAAKAVKGVRQIVRLDDAVAVVADHMGAAKKGLAALKIEWDEGPNAMISDRRHRAANWSRRRSARGAGAEHRRCRQGHGQRRHQGGSDLPGSVSRPRHDGADELHRAYPQGRVRDLGRHTGHHARAGGGGEEPPGLPLDKVVVHNHLIGGGLAAA